jgi:hypothetical protein
LNARPLGVSQVASWALTAIASSLVRQNTTKSSAYAEARVMPSFSVDVVVGEGLLVSGSA